MATSNIVRAVVTGNLTADPDLRRLDSGAPVCVLRVAATTHRKDRDTGEWTPKPNYLTVKVFGAQGENASRYLAKGRAVAVDGRLDWREWDAPDGGTRQALEIIADTVQFLGPASDPAVGPAEAQPPEHDAIPQ
jgi:single-strand DNA-binding protein